MDTADPTPIKKAVQRAGGARKVAERLRLSTQAIYANINGTRRPSDELLKFLGLERRVSYVRVNGR